jgi:stage IV sporulation protein FB
MAWQDRHYYRDSSGSTGNPLMWLLTGSVPLFTAFGIRVRAHASLVLISFLVLLLGLGFGATVADRVQFVTILFAIILLHEFGHCFAARYVGGDANEILMTPLGGLAMAYAPRRPWAQFVTVAGGPLVNVVICLLCGAGLYFLIGIWPLGPWQFGAAFGEVRGGFFQVASYLFWIYSISYFLLLFNLLPIFPLDGGQLLQSILWPKLGYYKSMMLMVNIGLGGSVLMVMVGIATFGTIGGGLLLIFIGISCFINCLSTRRMLLSVGPEDFADEGIDYSAAYEVHPGRSKPGRLARWSMRRSARRAQKLEREERVERERIDAILAKVSAKGMHSLTWLERRALRKATEHQRQRDLELGATRRY